MGTANAQPATVETSFQHARRVMAETFQTDQHMLQTYIDNIAMLVHDHHGVTDYDARNALALHVMGLVFGLPQEAPT